MKNFFIIILLTLWTSNLQAGIFHRSPQHKLFKAIKKNDIPMLQQLLNTETDPIDINSLWKNKETALTFAIKEQSVDIVKILLENGADPNQINGEYLPLELAVLKCNKKIVKLLIEKNVDINIISTVSGVNARHISDYAYQYCRNNIFKYFLDSINKIDFDSDIDLLKLSIGSSTSLRIALIANPAIKNPSDALYLLSDLSGSKLKFSNHIIDIFFNFSTKPTLRQIIAFAHLSSDPFPILNAAKKRGFAKSPQDYIDLYSNNGFLVFTNSEIDFFFELSPAPTIQQIISFANLSTRPFTILNKAHQKGIDQSPQDTIDLYSNRGPIKFLDSTIDRFLAFYPPPTPKQVRTFLAIVYSEKQKDILRKAIPILLKQSEPEIISGLKDQVKAKMEKLEEPSPNDLNRDSKEQFFQILQEHELSSVIKDRNLEGNPEELIICPICLEEKEKKYFKRCLNPSCLAGKDSYAVCSSCTKESLSLQFKEHTFPLSCDNCGTELPLTENDLDDLGLSDQKFSLEKGSILAYHNKLFPKAKNCASPDCINKIRKRDCNNQNKHYECKFCGYSYCFKCEEEHKGRSCKKYKEEKKGEIGFQKLLHDPKSNIRPCPYCQTPTEKREACDHMRCTQCKNSWDWKLGKTRGKEVHYSKTDGSEPRTYRVPGDKNMKTGTLYKSYQEKVENDF